MNRFCTILVVSYLVYGSVCANPPESLPGGESRVDALIGWLDEEIHAMPENERLAFLADLEKKTNGLQIIAALLARSVQCPHAEKPSK